ncbi:hypothetical protein AVEN_169653-1, partial [Araneus ventricosus]
ENKSCRVWGSISYQTSSIDLLRSLIEEKCSTIAVNFATLDAPKRSIYRVLSIGCIHKAKRRTGRPPMTNKRDDRQIQRLASSQEITVAEIQRSSELSVSKSTDS